jgi:hypothetical protein
MESQIMEEPPDGSLTRDDVDRLAATLDPIKALRS